MYTIGIDLGGTNLKGGICDPCGKLLKKLSFPTGRSASADDIMNGMAVLCTDLLDSIGASRSELDYVGLAAPGTMDLEKGELVFCNNLPFVNYPVVEEFSGRFNDCAVYLENDANAAALGEALCGGAKGCNDMVLITLGTGVGGGVIINGKIFSGFNYAGGELGHMVIEVGGRPCTCGRRGCWEAYSSASGLILFTKEAMQKHPESLLWSISETLDKVDGQTAFRAADKGDKTAQKVIDDYIKYLSTGVINIINILQPEVLCIGGGISNEGTKLFDPLIAAVEKEQYSRYCEKKTDIRLATLGNDAGIIGAAMLGKQQ